MFSRENKIISLSRAAISAFKGLRLDEKWGYTRSRFRTIVVGKVTPSYYIYTNLGEFQ